MLDLLKESYGFSYDINTDIRNWDEVEQIHHGMWEEALRNHRQNTRELISYKEGSLTTSHNARMGYLREQLQKASNPGIRQMREGEIRNATADYELHMEELRKAAEKADILFETLAYGVIVIE